MTIPHLVMTRFNVHLDELMDDVEGWMRSRVALFERFTVPSMAAQTSPPLKWLLFCDADPAVSPPWFRERLEGYGLPWLEPLWLEEVAGPELAQMIRDHAPSDAPYVITTRLDNDDAVARDYCERIQAEARPHREVLNFTYGAQYREGKIYRRPDPSNSFSSLVYENGPEPVTIYAEEHGLLNRVAPVRQIKTHPMWMQVIHGKNIDQPLVGIRSRPGPLLQYFAVDVPVVPAGLGTYADALACTARMAAKVARPSGLRRLARILGR